MALNSTHFFDVYPISPKSNRVAPLIQVCWGNNNGNPNMTKLPNSNSNVQNANSRVQKVKTAKLKGSKVQRSWILQNFSIAVFHQSIPEFRGTYIDSFCILQFAGLTFCTLPHAVLTFCTLPCANFVLLHPCT